MGAPRQRAEAAIAVWERAPAKINLLLRVLGRRADGYHELVSVMHTVDLADAVVVEMARGEPPGTVVVVVEGPRAQQLAETGLALEERVRLGGGDAGPRNLTNLATRAAAWLWERLATGSGPVATPGMGPVEVRPKQPPPAVRIRIVKRIPPAAGLGGGSADAAAVLRGLNRLWGWGLPPQALEAIATRIGADVPFCVRGGTQIARGIGDRLRPILNRLSAWYVLALPRATLATREVFELWDRLHPAGDVSPRAARGETRRAPGAAEIEAERAARRMAEALERGDLDGAASLVGNDLAEPARALYPPLEAVLGALRAEGLVGVCVSGSGPAAFGLADSWARAHRAAEAVRKRLAAEGVDADLTLGTFAPGAPSTSW